MTDQHNPSPSVPPQRQPSNLTERVRAEVREWEYQNWCRREWRDPEDTATMAMYENWYLDEHRVTDWNPDDAA